jgi:phosphatidylserine decarboxylase
VEKSIFVWLSYWKVKFIYDLSLGFSMPPYAQYVAIFLVFCVASAFSFWKLYFLRDPPKVIAPGNNVVSPADGLVVKIVPFGSASEKSVDKGLLGKVKFYTDDVAPKGYFIVIRLHLYDIHYQRSPIAGAVVTQKYSKGKFLNAVIGAEKLKATFENEKNEMLISGIIDGERVKTKVIQVAGFAARRIESYVKENQKLEKGEHLGVINLGSQVVLVVPEINLKIAEGDRVSGGETIIGVV